VIVADETSRKIIAALQVSLDGLIEGANGELDWIGSWDDSFDLLPEIDTCVLGGGMYPGYEQYWLGILADPEGINPLTGKLATKGEVEYARFADRTPHVVLSRTLDSPAWRTTRIVREIKDIRALRQQPGKDIHAVGGATLVSSLMNEDLIDEVRLTVHPIVLGKGKPLFKDVQVRHPLDLVQASPLPGGRVSLTYRKRLPSGGRTVSTFAAQRPHSGSCPASRMHVGAT
jgi:dihydrofolate reductase